MMPVAMLRSAPALQRGLIFVPGMVICFQIANSCTRWRRNFKGLSQHGGQANFSINICASLFNKDLLNEPNFGLIHLAGVLDEPLKGRKDEVGDCYVSINLCVEYCILKVPSGQIGSK